MKKLFVGSFSLFLGLLFLCGTLTLNQPAQGQILTCPEYTEHFKPEPQIKWCNGYFATWEICVYAWGELCPCMSEEEPECQ
ncbi:hypothetical protein [Algoriphagus hitonicola]|uniref:NVEALA protein n=1 Tax=Algoriphagus hitonicola TaxID=435880 RepID=A0A1I2WFQ8_9BACT|nr:hypothetical protein [Algoriphagus hitonicola]SFG99579.1 hypothetical protein SAMN04487988_11297 [Algoriphagus hitonicola]